MLPNSNIQRLLKEIVDHFDKEDRQIRERQIRTWRRLKLFWEGFQKAWYSEVAHDWRIWDENVADDSQQAYYDKPINVFRAYLESIIAALSVTVPPIKCFPDDADNNLDLLTAKAGDKIAQLIYRHNDVPLLWLHALFIFCTEGMVACYTYPESKKEYGTFKKNEYEEVEEEHDLLTCPICGYTLGDVTENPRETDFGSEICPSCGNVVSLLVKKETFKISRLVGVTELPKTRIKMDAFGGLYVKVPIYARKQEDCPYLIWSYETHYVNAIERFEHLRGKKLGAMTGVKDPYEQWGRLSPQYQGTYPVHNVTVRNAWLRPCAFNVIQDEDDVEELKRLYPEGVKVVLVNDEFGEAVPENLDDHWTLTYNPLSDYIHHDPLGLLLVSVQEITNDLISLILQTIEHGIGQTFADPEVLNFNAYRQMESIPGGIYEAKPRSGKSLGDSFYEVRTASLSPEIMPFALNVQSLAQLVSGALPSLFGGQLEGTETASEYSMSRAQALQRLQNIWKMLTVWWKQIFGKAIPAYIREVREDERDVQMDKDGNFINVFIRRAELEGRIGRVELEANDNLPLTWSQQKDIIMSLLNAANPEVLSILGSPENLPIIRSAIGLTDFFVPGEDSRNKQNDEIKLLLNSDPIPTDSGELPSVDVDVLYDNHEIEFETVRKWVNSEAGRQARADNPNGYRNVLLHGRLHFMQLKPPMLPQEGGAPNPEKPSQASLKNAPIQGEENVATIQ